MRVKVISKGYTDYNFSVSEVTALLLQATVRFEGNLNAYEGDPTRESVRQALMATGIQLVAAGEHGHMVCRTRCKMYALP